MEPCRAEKMNLYYHMHVYHGWKFTVFRLTDGLKSTLQIDNQRIRSHSVNIQTVKFHEVLQPKFNGLLFPERLEVSSIVTFYISQGVHILAEVTVPVENLWLKHQASYVIS
jgi:hypothetical protein